MYKRILKRILFALVFCVIFPLNVYASSDLFFTPASGSFKVDEPFQTRVISESSESLSAVEATIEFDPKLYSVKILKASSDVSWVVTPSVDEEAGQIHFSGIVSKDAPLQLELLHLSVVGLRPGVNELRFVSGASTVAADGTGGNTLGKVTHALFDIVTDDGYDSSNINGEVLGAKDSKLTITSPQIANEESWYAFKDIIFNWNLPFGVSDTLVSLTKKKEDVGIKKVQGSTTTREVKDIEDGEWYFHVTPDGKGLEDTAHLRVALDNVAPTISTTKEKDRPDKKDPNITFIIEAKDETSGISHFEISEDNGPSNRWEDDGTHEYKFRSRGIGDHDLTISAFDKANNRSEAHVRFSVEPLDLPVVRLLRKEVPEASPIIAEIKGIPNASVVVTFEGENVSHDDTIALDANGVATYILKESVLPGDYQISVLQKIENGASSKSGERIDLKVTPSVIGYLGRHMAISIVVIPLVVIAILFILWRFWFIPFYRRRYFRQQVVQKVAPMSLMEPSSKTRMMAKNNVVQVAPLELKKTVRLQNQNSVIDLRRK